jgi:hypothetical protein
MKVIKRIARWFVWCLNYNSDTGHHPYYYGEAHSNEGHYFRGFPKAWSMRVMHGWTPPPPEPDQFPIRD